MLTPGRTFADTASSNDYSGLLIKRRMFLEKFLCRGQLKCIRYVNLKILGFLHVVLENLQEL